VAAPRFSVQPLHWCFPISGCVDYRGYFHEHSARTFAARLAKRGDDVRVEGVTAYSTLGHFADPVLSTMLRYGDLDLVGTLFHELAHQLYYVAGDSEFDESFAMTVEAQGLSLWLAAQGRSGELQSYSAQQRLEDAVDQLFADTRARLKRLYAMPLPAASKLARKQAILEAVGAQVRALERSTHLLSGYDDWIAAGLNNADLAAAGTYSDCVPGFERLLQQNHGQLPAFYAAVRRIGRDPLARRALCAQPQTPAAVLTAPVAAPALSVVAAPATAEPAPPD
jgi:predicted aminopeptidase